MRPIAARRAREIVDGADTKLNAAFDLFRIVSSTICCEYYGVVVDDEGEFADWAIALSTVFFGDPTADTVVRELAIAASRNIGAAIDRSIDTVNRGGHLAGAAARSPGRRNAAGAHRPARHSRHHDGHDHRLWTDNAFGRRQLP